jgi:putative MATE family efflux protein
VNDIASLPAADPRPPGLLRLAWPIFAEQSLHMLTNVVSTLMASRIGDNAVAGLGSASQILVMFLIGFNVLAVGASIATTHHLGLGDRAGARRMARGAVATNLWLGGLFSVLLAVTAPTLLRWAQLTPPLLAYALPYLHWMGGTLFMESMIFALCAVLRAHGHTREVMFVILAQNAVNAGLSALLIFGLGGLPAMGVTGIAIAASLSRLLALIALWVLVRRLVGLRMAPRDLVTIRIADLRRLLSLGFPAVLENISWFASFMIITALTARMGERMLATQAYTMQIAQIEMLACLSIGIGNEIVVGRLVGAGRFEEARVQCLANMRLGLIVTVGVAIVFAIVGPWALRMFTNDPQIVSLGRTLILLGLLLEPGRSFNLIIINALRASGDSRFPLIAGLISQCGIMLFGAWLLGTWFGLGLIGVWIALIVDEWLRGLYMLQRWRRGRWLKHARRVQAEAAAHPAHSAFPSRSFS